jgi:hypothetical protein
MLYGMPEMDLPHEPWQDGPLPVCRRCGNNGLRTRMWRGASCTVRTAATVGARRIDTDSLF